MTAEEAIRILERELATDKEIGMSEAYLITPECFAAMIEKARRGEYASEGTVLADYILENRKRYAEARRFKREKHF